MSSFLGISLQVNENRTAKTDGPMTFGYGIDATDPTRKNHELNEVDFDWRHSLRRAVSDAANPMDCSFRLPGQLAASTPAGSLTPNPIQSQRVFKLDRKKIRERGQLTLDTDWPELAIVCRC
ncbi:hypothetical protein DPM33_20505 [Mesorhizobium hawassense]|uniref:Uncharacterized protein n=1 Tax=Mesorhizobium hawassense TaxID=1209954 RepID=A0A330HQ32_9HYPH|nr:hypothetical protein DPM33_20505 [Mesorhizobium hawassense]